MLLPVSTIYLDGFNFLDNDSSQIMFSPLMCWTGCNIIEGTLLSYIGLAQDMSQCLVLLTTKIDITLKLPSQYFIHNPRLSIAR